jgi:hypothetical protein
MKLIPFIIFIIIVINVLRRIAEYHRNRPKTGAGWNEWVPPAEPTDPVSRPPPSERVREILEQLAQGDRSAPAPMPRPVVAPVPPPVPQPVPLPPPLRQPAPAPRLAAAASRPRRYLSEAVEGHSTTIQQAAVSSVPKLSAALGRSQIFGESLAKAFPGTPLGGREAQARRRVPYVLRVKGRKPLRHALVLTEVLGPARAFDI